MTGKHLRTLRGRPASSPSVTWLVMGLAALSGCASAPVVERAPLTVDDRLALVIHYESQRVLGPPAPPSAPPPTIRREVPAPLQPPSLADLVADSDARVRYRAARAIGRVGLVAGEAALTAALGADPDPTVRLAAAFGLELLGSGSATASDALVMALADSSLLVRGRAAAALAAMGIQPIPPGIAELVTVTMPTASEVPPDAMPVAVEPAVEAFRLAVSALATLGAADELIRTLVSPDGDVLVRWWPVADALARVADPRLGETLERLAQGTAVFPAAHAARGLGAIGGASSVEVLIDLLEPGRHSPVVIAAALQALGQLGSGELTAAVLELVGAPGVEIGVLRDAIRALGARGGEALEATDLLLDLLSHPSPELRAAALRSLARVSEQVFLIAVSGLDRDPHWSVRAALAESLVALEPELALPRLTSLLEDPDQRVVPVVLRALGRLRAPGAADLGLARLGADDLGVRASAAALVGELRPAGGWRSLTEAFDRARADSSEVARLAALEAIDAYANDEAEALAFVESTLDDEQWPLRVRAARLLERRDPALDLAPTIRPAPGAVDLEEAARLANPAVSPQVYLETSRGTIQIELAVVDAPVATDRFARLAATGFFNGLTFHRVDDGVVTGGDPRGDGLGGPGFTLRDEVSERPIVRGTVVLDANAVDAGGSRFSIALAPQPARDGRQTVIGHVVEGLEVADTLRPWDAIRRTRVWDGVSMVGR